MNIYVIFLIVLIAIQSFYAFLILTLFCKQEALLEEIVLNRFKIEKLYNMIDKSEKDIIKINKNKEVDKTKAQIIKAHASIEKKQTKPKTKTNKKNITKENNGK